MFLAVLDEDGNVVRAMEFHGDDDPNDVVQREQEKGPRPMPESESEPSIEYTRDEDAGRQPGPPSDRAPSNWAVPARPRV